MNRKQPIEEKMRPAKLTTDYNKGNFKKEGLGCVGPVEESLYA